MPDNVIPFDSQTRAYPVIIKMSILLMRKLKGSHQVPVAKGMTGRIKPRSADSADPVFVHSDPGKSSETGHLPSQVEGREKQEGKCLAMNEFITGNLHRRSVSGGWARERYRVEGAESSWVLVCECYQGGEITCLTRSGQQPVPGSST